MNTVILILGAVVLVGALFVVIPSMMSAYLRFRGRRVITCPERLTPEGVEIDTARATLSAIAGSPRLRLSDCSRWPERSRCGQQCLAEIEASPEGCLIRNILSRWYAGKRCALCGTDVSRAAWSVHRPALMDAERRTIEWSAVPGEEIYEIFSTHQPVCWNCHIAETFRREHPDLVVERPARPGAHPGAGVL